MSMNWSVVIIMNHLYIMRHKIYMDPYILILFWWDFFMASPKLRYSLYSRSSVAAISYFSAPSIPWDTFKLFFSSTISFFLIFLELFYGKKKIYRTIEMKKNNWINHSNSDYIIIFIRIIIIWYLKRFYS